MGKSSQTPDFKDHPVQDNHRDLFLNAIQDVKGYLLTLKMNNGFFPGISTGSEQLINQWGTVIVSEAPFFSQGPQTASVYIVDSTAGFYEGKSGRLLVKILSAMTLTCDQVFICSCDNLPLLNQTIITHSPKVIIALGSKAGKSLCATQEPLTRFRGRFFEYRGVKVMPTFHPSLLVKDPQYKRQVWDDMKQVMAVAGLSHDA